MPFRHLAFSLAVALATPAGASAEAEIVLTGATAQMIQTGDTAWLLIKEGEVDAGASTVTWTITATPEAGGPGAQLVVDGTFTVQNTGTDGATIGNIVVNLQTKSAGGWQTRSSDVADATSDDAATSAQVVAKASSEKQSQFTENAASGPLQFMDANTNTIFALVPQVTIPAGASRTLLFSAAFDNEVLGLAVRTAARAEILVSFGNASARGKSVPNLDINGNGVIDADEAHVRTVPARLGLTVPAEGPSEVILTDALDDITTTGTVTFSDAVFNLGATTGTVSVSYDGGADGGTITNCAHLTGDALDLTACDTQTIDGPTCTPGSAGCEWSSGDQHSFVQLNWDSSAFGAPLLTANYSSVYASTSGIFDVGIVSTNAFSMSFTTVTALLNYLPATGTVAALTSDLVNPTSSSSGQFGGDVVALKLNIDFSVAGLLTHDPSAAFGDLVLCAVTPSGLNGTNVRNLLVLANTLLSAQPSPYSLAEVAALVSEVNFAFNLGTPSAFAQDHLVNGPCPWQQGDMQTFTQSLWGDPVSAGGQLVGASFDTVYASGILEVGISGTSGFSMAFMGGSAIHSYLPAVGVSGSLTGDLVNPTSSSSGAFGGEVVALELNVAFSDAGLLAGSAALGDLRICGFALLPQINTLTVRQFLAAANNLLGGGTASFNPDQAAAVAAFINSAFLDGSPSVFAQDNLVDGDCP